MKFPHLFHKLFCQPLMLHAPVRSSFEMTLLSRMRGEATPVPPARVVQEGGAFAGSAALGDPGRVRDDWINFDKDYRATKEAMRIDSIYKVVGNVAIIKIHGVIDKLVSQFEMDCYGACDLADVDQALSLAAANPRVSKVVLWIDSPGGSVIGVADTAARIAELRKTKEIHAFIPAMAASAGYYLASQADLIAAAQSAVIGSIGVYIAVLDASAWYSKEGLAMQVMKEGDLKTMGAEWRPLTDTEKDFLQASVKRNYDAFKAAVTTLRPVADSTMQGQWWDAATAKPLHLVDELTGATLDEYVSALLLN